MASNVVRRCGIVGVSLCMLSSMVIGCGKEQAPPPAQTPPPAGTAQTAPAPPTQNASQIQIGMTSEQVQQIMGPPVKVEQESSGLEWKYYTPQGEVEVKLVNNRVTTIERK